MLRFVGLVWDAKSSAESSRAQLLIHSLQDADSTWCRLFSSNGMQVLAANGPSRPQTIRLGERHGAIVGSLFERQVNGTSCPVRSLPEDEAADIVRSGGRRLVERYWGSYVGFLEDPQSKRKWILRGPRTFLNCFATALDGIRIYFSRTEDVASLNGLRLTVDLNHVALCVVYGSGGTRGSAIREISEIKPGECIEHGGPRIRKSFYWNPGTIAKSDPLENIGEAAAEIRQVVSDSVHAFASLHGRLVHKLSGGLDSSIVLCCLSDAPSRPEVICRNDYSPGPESDERKYARLVAQQSRCELVEQLRPAELRFERFLGAVRTAVPSPQFLEIAHDRPAVDLALQRAATAVCTGAQGDATFYMYPAAPAAVDFAARHGLRPELLKVALDVARLERTSIWHVLGTVVKAKFHRSRFDYWEIQRQFLEVNPGRNVVNTTAVEDATRRSEFVDPWFREIEGVPPGKLWQIFQMTSASAYEDSFSATDDPEPLHPLMAQPIAEVCLRIPTYTHLTNGWDRAVARLAFAKTLPRQIYLRTTKGGLEEYAKDVTMKNIGFTREVLLNGQLVKERILNRSILAEALRQSPTRTSVTAAMLLIYLGVEVWLNTWKCGTQRAAA